MDAYYQDVIERVDDRASVLMVVPDQASLDGMKEMLRRRAPRRRVLLFNAQARTDPWVRDKIVVARSPGGIKLLMRPGYDGDTESLRKFAQAAGIEVQRLELNHQGGDLLFDGENLFVGQRTVESNPPWEQSQRQRRKEILAGKFMAAFGPDVKVYFVPDPLLYHLDVSMTLLPGRKVVLGDAALGLRGLEEETPERRQALFSAFKERERPQRWRDLTAWTGEILLEQEAIRVDLESARRLARVAPDLEATRRDLRLAGFEVTAVPLALGYQYIDINRTGKIVPLTSYNNVLFLGGTVLMPEAGLALDESARRAYESLGYSVGSLPQAVALSAREGGARCAGVPIPRTPETVWQLQRLAAAAKADPRFYVHGGGALAP